MPGSSVAVAVTVMPKSWVVGYPEVIIIPRSGGRSIAVLVGSSAELACTNVRFRKPPEKNCRAIIMVVWLLPLRNLEKRYYFSSVACRLAICQRPLRLTQMCVNRNRKSLLFPR